MTASAPQHPVTPRPYNRKKGPDSALFGFLIGIVCPVVGLILLYFIWSGSSSMGNFFKMFVTFDSPTLMTTSSKALSLAVITNLLPFYFFLNRKRYLTVRGLLMSMVLFLVLIVLYKFVWQ